MLLPEVLSIQELGTSSTRRPARCAFTVSSSAISNPARLSTSTLSRKSFEKYDSGIRIGGGDRPNADYTLELDVAYA